MSLICTSGQLNNTHKFFSGSEFLIFETSGFVIFAKGRAHLTEDNWTPVLDGGVGKRALVLGGQRCAVRHLWKAALRAGR
jgi:hypothetical protein